MSHVGKINYPLDDASMARTATDLSGPRAFGGGDKKPAADLRALETSVVGISLYETRPLLLSPQ
jgi:hypothetical protein